MLEQLEQMHAELGAVLPEPDGDVAIVLHGTDTQLVLARPGLLAARRAATPAARRLLAGAAGQRELHVLTRRRLAERAGDADDTRTLLLLTPAALYARMVVAAASPGLRASARPRTAQRALAWAWLLAGAAEWLSGQTEHLRAVLGRRLRDAPSPSLPLRLRDAHVLGGALVDLLARERGDDAALALIRRAGRGDPWDAVAEAFGGRPLRDTEDAWRAHLRRLAGTGRS